MRREFALASCAVLALLSMCFSGCSGSKAQGRAENAESKAPPGELVGLTYNRTRGTVAGEDFFIALSSEEVVSTVYWPSDYSAFENTKEHIPISREQWAEVEQVVLELYPLMNELSDSDGDTDGLWPEIEVLDGGDSDTLTLTWDTGSGTQTTEYSWPNDRRVLTLTALLEELAEPTGREIPRYDPPELCGIYIGHSYWRHSKDYSFNLNPDSKSDDPENPGYILYARFHITGEGDSVSYTLTVPDEEWEAFKEFAQELELENCPDGKAEKPYCTLYYSDGKQQRKELDANTEKQLRQYLTELAMRLCS